MDVKRHIKTRSGKSTKTANFVLPEWKTITDLILQELHELQAMTPAEEYLKEHCLSKFVSEETDPASHRRNRAIAKWLACENENDATEHRLLNSRPDDLVVSRVGLTYGRLTEKAQDVIHHVLGDTVPVGALFGGFTGGASTSRGRTVSFPAGKYVGKADITVAALGLFTLVREESPGWYVAPEDPLEVRVVRGNVLFCVPKTAEIDRVCAKEPDLNMYMQKGLGVYIATRLRRLYGIDISDQSRNRDLARQGSATGNLATIDLSSASDSVTCELISQLLPPMWNDVLRAVRSPETLIDGTRHVNVMISSMGNGFTFPLQTLVFFALAKATCYLLGVRGTISVYGDDIILPTPAASPFFEVLDWFGFQPNQTKSFIDGPIRESCGGHYYLGHDITPFYVKGPIKTVTDAITLANNIRLWSFRQGFGGVNNDRFFPVWELLRDSIPKRYWGGSNYGSSSQLVTPGRPHSQIISETETRSHPAGGLMMWLDLKASGSCDSFPIATEESAQARAHYRSVRIPRTRCPRNTGLSLFLSEIGV